MVYRISEALSDGRTREWDVNEVYEWSKNLMELNDELKNAIHPIDILYTGTFYNLYPDIKIDEKWHENLLKRLKTEKKFGNNISR